MKPDPTALTSDSDDLEWLPAMNLNNCLKISNGCPKISNGCRKRSNGCRKRWNGCPKRSNGCPKRWNGCPKRSNGYPKRWNESLSRSNEHPSRRDECGIRSNEHPSCRDECGFRSNESAVEGEETGVHAAGSPVGPHDGRGVIHGPVRGWQRSNPGFKHFIRKANDSAGNHIKPALICEGESFTWERVVLLFYEGERFTRQKSFAPRVRGRGQH